MKLQIFSDIHRDWQALREIVRKDADVYICLGDLSSWDQGLNEAGGILAPLGKKLWLLPGNSETHKQTQDLCERYGFEDFHKKSIKQGQYFLVGFGLTSPTPFKTLGELREQEIKKSLEKFKGLKNLILFTHVPPKNTNLDKTSSGVHAGSLAVREFIEKNTPLYCFSGHVHENEGKKEKIDNTICYLVGKNSYGFNLNHTRSLIK